jgi:membrane-associated phospholipid phosphatase
MEERKARLKPLRRLFTRTEALELYLVSGFFVCALVVFLFGMLAREVFRTPTTRRLDREVTLAVRELQSPANDRLARIATFFGSHLFILPATVLAMTGLVRKGHRASAVLFCGSVLGGFGLNALLKIAFARQRPDLWPALVAERTYSFPSGHAAMSMVFFGGAAAVMLHLSRRPVVRGAVLVFSTVAILTIASTRVYLGAHWTTDVTAGILVGLFWVSVCATATKHISLRVAASVGAPESPATDAGSFPAGPSD